MKLTDLKKLRLSKEDIYAKAGLNPVTMRSRITRNAPELTPLESKALLKALKGLIKTLGGIK